MCAPESDEESNIETLNMATKKKTTKAEEIMRIIFMLSLSAWSREKELFIVQKSINLERRVT